MTVARRALVAALALGAVTVAAPVVAERAWTRDFASGSAGARSLGGCALAPSLQHQAPGVPFSVGERAEYEVRFGPIRVGHASMEVAGIDTVRGHSAWHSIFRIDGGTFFYHVHDRLESWMDQSSLASLRFVQQLEEGSRDREHHFEIFPSRSVYTDNAGAEQASVPDPLDDGSFLFFVRTIPLEVGHEYVFDRYFRPDHNPVRIRVLRRERIEVPDGSYDAIVVQPIIRTKGIFSEGGHAEVWLSDDDKRIILQMKSSLSIGSLNLYLTGYTAGGDTTAQGDGRR